MKKIAVILSGCGVYDGSEIYESVLTLLFLERHGLAYQCFAPNTDQLHVINHLTGEVVPDQQRNVLVESARLARGEITDLADANPDEYSGLIIPGGFGAAKNLSDFAISGANCSVDPLVENFTRAIHQAGKPVGLICIAPAMTPKIFGQDSLCTIGNDEETAAAIEAMGGQHQNCPVDNIVIDHQRKIVTTPAYMLANSISDASIGIEKLVGQIAEMV